MSLEQAYDQKCAECASLREQLAKAERQRDELKADAERYRWLREQNETLSADSFVVLSRDVECAHCESTWVGADLDAAIAEARKEKVDG